jgi:hypothetical protein
MRAPLLATIAACVAFSAQAQPAPFEFRGARLGMTTEEWRALPVPEQVYGPAVPRCSTDDPKAGWATQLSDAQAAGIVTCVYVKTEGNYAAGQRLGGSELTSVEYRFRGGKLFEISLVGADLALPTLLDGLTAKYGRPQTRDRSSTTRTGNPVPQVTAVWRANRQSIEVVSPSLRLDRFTATVSDDAALSAANAARKAARGPDDAI